MARAVKTDQMTAGRYGLKEVCGKGGRFAKDCHGSVMAGSPHETAPQSDHGPGLGSEKGLENKFASAIAHPPYKRNTVMLIMLVMFNNISFIVARKPRGKNSKTLPEALSALRRASELGRQALRWDLS